MSFYFIFGISIIVVGSIVGGIAAAISAKDKKFDENGMMH